MASGDTFEAVRGEMLRLLVARGIKNTRLLAAMDRVPRERFVPAEVRRLAYADRALPIGSS